AATAAGARFRTADGPTYQYDRWIQDSHETGAYYLTAPNQTRRRVDGVLMCARYREIDDWVPATLWGPDFGLVAPFGTTNGAHNYGGNLEIAPAYSIPGGASFPWGRICSGGGTGMLLGTTHQVTENMDSVYREFFDASHWQGPHLELSSEW